MLSFFTRIKFIDQINNWIAILDNLKSFYARPNFVFLMVLFIFYTTLISFERGFSAQFVEAMINLRNPVH